MPSKKFDRDISASQPSDDLLAAVRRLKEEKMTKEEAEEVFRSVLAATREKFEKAGGVFYDDVNGVYRSFRDKTLLVRSENPAKLIEAIGGRKDLILSFDPDVGERYANCAEWRYEDGSRGLENAFIEGHDITGGLRMIVGFEDGPDLDVQELSGSRRIFNDLKRDLVHSAQGRVHPEEVKFAVVRVPAEFFPKEMMTEKEKERLDEEKDAPASPRAFHYIFRGFVFGN